ncbi:hypothetical protein GCM10017044_04930 [Kordiimonas sediminis]|uniref:Terminase small subunit n=1 Tax=Kordiimonas sediminis TaxID=1735581 RepID=A0A919E532_9PROT|nr:terminase small subunit [Kordiimonas sediminis]GHF13856.1 hypothetical protein GCM10017044_04930 [Kordiimonas sediminis]
MPAADWDKRHIFAREYARSNNATDAARKAGVPAASAHTVAYKWLRNPQIVNLIKKEIDLALRDLGPAAVSVIRDLMTDPDTPPRTRLAAAKDIMDRLGWIPPKRTDVSFSSQVRDITTMTRAELEEAATGISGFSPSPQLLEEMIIQASEKSV